MKSLSTHRLLFTLLSCLALFTAPAQSLLDSGLHHPESVVRAGRYIYVSNIGKVLDPLARDGDGAIRQFSAEGALLKVNMCRQPLHAPKGLVAVKQLLYVADLECLLGIEAQSGNIVSVISFSSLGVQLLNDIAVKNDSTLFVSATDQGRVFEVGTGNKQYITVLEIPHIKGANGLCYDAVQNCLYVCGLGSFTAPKGEGELGCVHWRNGKPVYKRLTNATGFFDGIALLDRDHLLLSDWRSLSKPEGILVKINLHTGAVHKTETIPFGGPADFYLDKSAHRILVPATQKGELWSLPLDGAELVLPE